MIVKNAKADDIIFQNLGHKYMSRNKIRKELQSSVGKEICITTVEYGGSRSRVVKNRTGKILSTNDYYILCDMGSYKETFLYSDFECDLEYKIKKVSEVELSGLFV